MRYFIDTSAFVALADRADQYHQSATRFFREEVGPSDQLHTSNFVIDETITRLRSASGYQIAVTFAEKAYSTHVYQIHTVDRELEHEALKLLRRFHDHELSFTDCTTAALASRLSTRHLFAYDHVFQQIGYVLVPNPWS